MNKEFMSFKEAIEYLNISRSTGYKLTSDKSIKFFKPKGKLFFRKQDLIDYITKNNPTKHLSITNSTNAIENGK